MGIRGRGGAATIALALVAGLGAACDGGGDGALTEGRLSAMIDSLLPPIAEVSGLEVRRPVRYALQSRSEARTFIERQLDEGLPPGELAGMERVYRAFGLLPDTLDLRALLLELLTEQVVGYYDPPTGRLYVVEGVSEELAGPVVAHELVHALQDQHVNLDSLVAPERGNDRRAAAQAAAEGQAMLVMVALQVAATSGRPMDVGSLPDVGEMMKPALEAENARFPVFQRAPRIIQETLIFPYIGGASFVQALFRHREGSEPPMPFGDLLPQSTEQVMNPERAFLGQRDHPTELLLGDPSGGWSVAYSNTLGQLEVSILLSERLGPGAEAAAEGWDGDRYILLDGPGGQQALVWYAVWDDATAADRFAEHYERWSVSRGGGREGPDEETAGFGPGIIDRLEVEGRPLVRVVETSPGTEPAAVPVPAIESLEERAWH